MNKDNTPFWAIAGFLAVITVCAAVQTLIQVAAMLMAFIGG